MDYSSDSSVNEPKPELPSLRLTRQALDELNSHSSSSSSKHSSSSSSRSSNNGKSSGKGKGKGKGSSDSSESSEILPTTLSPTQSEEETVPQSALEGGDKHGQDLKGTNDSADEEEKTKTGVIYGLTAIIIICILVIGSGAFWCYKRQQKKYIERQQSAFEQNAFDSQEEDEELKFRNISI
jgi:cobalamin biosynthesis Mg chelatase CobN